MPTRQHIIEPAQGHSHTFIFLHGRDSTAGEFASEFVESQASDSRTFPKIFPSMKWVFPTAKSLVSKRFGIEMSQWFDMWSTEDPEFEVRDNIPLAGLGDSVDFLLDLISREAEILGDSGSKRIVLGGISQGCATAIYALINSKIGPLGGFIGLCGWLSTEGNLKDTISEAKEDLLLTPVFLAHSLADPVINIEYGENLQRSLQNLGMTVEWKTYDNEEHWITEPEGVDDMVVFLNKIITSNSRRNSSHNKTLCSIPHPPPSRTPPPPNSR